MVKDDIRSHVYKQNVSGRVSLLPETELWPVSFNKTSTKRRSVFPETFIVHVFPVLPSFFHTETLFPGSIFVSKLLILLPLFHGVDPSMRAVTKILRARASEHSSNFCEEFEQRPNFAVTFKLKWDHSIPFVLAQISFRRAEQKADR